MGFRQTIEVTAPMDVVLAAIRDDAREWRESVIPPELREQHVVGITGELSRRRFEWSYDCAGYDGGPDVILRGIVEPRPDRTSTVRVWCGIPRPDWPTLIIYALLGGLALSLLTEWPASWDDVGAAARTALMLASGIVVTTWLSWIVRPAITFKSDHATRYLVQRLRQALEAAERRAGRDASSPDDAA